MKRFILLISAIFLSTSGYSDNQSNQNIAKSLGSAWKTQQLMRSQQDKDELIVYGGVDISRKPLIPHAAA